MWSKLWTWAKVNTLLALVIVVASIIAVSSVVDGVSMRQTAQGYLDSAKGWAAAYTRDTAASKKEYEARIKALTSDRDTYRKKWEGARGKMNAPWTPPKGAKETEARFRALGYGGKVK